MDLIPDYDWNRDTHLFKMFIDDQIEALITAEVERQGLMESIRSAHLDRRVVILSGIILQLGYLHDINGQPRTMRRYGQARKWLELRGLV